MAAKRFSPAPRRPPCASGRFETPAKLFVADPPPALREWAIPGEEFPLNRTDLARARQLLAEAGYPNGLTTTLTSANARDDFMNLAQLLQAQLAQIGVRVRIDALEWSTYVDTWRRKAMDLMVDTNGGATDVDRSLHFYWATEGGANVWNDSKRELDALIDKARREHDPAARHAPYAEAQRVVVDDVVNAFLLSPMRFIAVRNDVQNYTPMPNEQNLYLTKTWLGGN